MCFVSYEQMMMMPKTKLRHAQSTFSFLIHPRLPALWRLKCEQKVR